MKRPGNTLTTERGFTSKTQKYIDSSKQRNLKHSCAQNNDFIQGDFKKEMSLGTATIRNGTENKNKTSDLRLLRRGHSWSHRPFKIWKTPIHFSASLHTAQAACLNHSYHHIKVLYKSIHPSEALVLPQQVHSQFKLVVLVIQAMGLKWDELGFCPI